MFANALLPSIDASMLDPVGRRLHKIVDKTGYTVDIVSSPGTEVPHRHTGFEMVFVHGGLVVWWVGDSLQLLFPGDVLLFDAGQFHASRPLNGSYVRTTIHVLPEAIGSGAVERLTLSTGPVRRIRLPDPVAPSVFRWICVLRESNAARDGRARANTALEQIMGEVVEAAASPLEPVIHPILGDVLQYMIEHVESEETIEELADRFYVSKGHLHHIFRKTLGCSPVRVWQVIKMEVMCRRLLAGDPSVAELASGSGFATRRGFQRAFKKIVGVSVETFRNRLDEA